MHIYHFKLPVKAGIHKKATLIKARVIYKNINGDLPFIYIRHYQTCRTLLCQILNNVSHCHMVGLLQSCLLLF
jgi:hypothetical protein